MKVTVLLFFLVYSFASSAGAAKPSVEFSYIGGGGNVTQQEWNKRFASKSVSDGSDENTESAAAALYYWSLYWLTIAKADYLNAPVVKASALKFGQFKKQFGCYFDNTLIAGASVSSGFPDGKITPAGKYLTEFVGAKKPANIAAHGKMARGKSGMLSEIYSYMEEAKSNPKKSPISSVVAIDLFFWDADDGPKYYLGEGICEDSVKAAEDLIQMSNEKTDSFFLVLGTVPTAPSPVFQDEACRKKINQVIRDQCRGHCMFLDAAKMMGDLRKNGYLTYKGRRVDQSQLIFDGLHMSSTAQFIVAHSIIEEMVMGTRSCVNNDLEL